MSRPVSLHSELRPLVNLLNRRLAVEGAEPVQHDELDKIDRLLEAALATRASDALRCAHCGGYLGPDEDGWPTCLNCARPAGGPTMMLDEVAQNIARKLIASRAGES